MRKNAPANAADDTVIARHLEQHPVYRTPGLSFWPLPLTGAARVARRLPEPGELHLWRFRPQWNTASGQDAALIVSDVEQSRARRGYSPALSKRYLTGRALLRCVLSGMLGCPPEHLQLKDSPDGQPELVHPAPSHKLVIQVAYAGIWILIGMGATEFGISAATPLAYDPQRERTASRSLIADNDMAPNATEAASSVRHVIDLPMPGRLSAAVATKEPVSRILAYGWRRN